MYTWDYALAKNCKLVAAIDPALAEKGYQQMMTGCSLRVRSEQMGQIDGLGSAWSAHGATFDLMLAMIKASYTIVGLHKVGSSFKGYWTLHKDYRLWLI